MESPRKCFCFQIDTHNYQVVYQKNITKINITSLDGKNKWQSIIDEKSNLKAKIIYKIFNKFHKKTKSDTEIFFPTEWSSSVIINLKTTINFTIYCWGVALFMVKADTKFIIEEINLLRNHIYELQMNMWHLQQNLIGYPMHIQQPYSDFHNIDSTKQNYEDLANDINNLLENHYRVNKPVELIY
jgi:hypothetical protein